MPDRLHRITEFTVDAVHLPADRRDWLRTITVAVGALLHRYAGTPLVAEGVTSDGSDTTGPMAIDADLMLADLPAPLRAQAAGAMATGRSDVLVDVLVGDAGARGRIDVAGHLDVAGMGDALSAQGPRFIADSHGGRYPRLADVPGVDETTERRLMAHPDPAGATADVPVDVLVQRMAAERGGSIAVSDGRCSLTYTQLCDRASRVAAGLRSVGVRRGALVGVMLDRGVDAVTALLAVSMADAVAVPLDPGYPDRRIAVMLDEPRVAGVITGPGGSGRMPDGIPPMTLDDLAAQGSDGAATVGGDRGSVGPATVLYTSGSTGQPKGVVLTHSGIARLVGDRQHIDIRMDDVVLGHAPLTFDASLLEVWGALANGARLEIAPPGPLSLSELAEVIVDRRVNLLFLTTGLFHQIAEYEPECLGAVRTLLTGGDVLLPHHVRAVLERWPGLRVVNGYGPTENCTFTCCHVVADRAETGGSTIPIGRPIARTTVYLVDAYGHLVPPGIVGELWAAGDGLAEGYLGRPDLTAERFVTPTTGPLRGIRMYRTGDLVFQRPDGLFDFVGRRDLQVKINGFRIELPEVEAAVLTHPDVREVCVTVAPDALGGKLLRAHVVADRDSAALTAELRAALRGRLPHFMIPTHWRVLDELPLNANGKVDRAALAADVPARKADLRP